MLAELEDVALGKTNIFFTFVLYLNTLPLLKLFTRNIRRSNITMTYARDRLVDTTQLGVGLGVCGWLLVVRPNCELVYESALG